MSFLDSADLARFLNKVAFGDSCWEWQGHMYRCGYGQIKVKRKSWAAHRLSYSHFVGPIPEGLYVCHRCDNKKCVRPDHLFIGTHQDNMDDMKSKSRSAAGARNGSKTHPERYPRGADHYMAKDPSRSPRCPVELLRRGTAHPQAKLDPDKVRDIRQRSGELGYAWLAQVYGVANSTIRNVVENKTWKHVL